MIFAARLVCHALFCRFFLFVALFGLLDVFSAFHIMRFAPLYTDLSILYQCRIKINLLLLYLTLCLQFLDFFTKFIVIYEKIVYNCFDYNTLKGKKFTDGKRKSIIGAFANTPRQAGRAQCGRTRSVYYHEIRQNSHLGTDQR